MNSLEQGIDGVEAKTTGPGRILVVDDEDIIRVLPTEILTEDGYEIVTAPDGRDAIEILEHEQFDLIISDMVMPGMNGIEVLQAAFRIDPHYQVIMITGYPSVETAVRLVNLGAADYITKPFNVDLIKVTVAKVLEMKKIRGGGGAPVVEASQATPGVDGLTDAFNYSMFNVLLQNEIGRSERKGHVCSLMVIEIDKFENYIQKGGTAAGDELLKSLASIIRQEARVGDILGRTDHAEFTLILPETDRTEVEAVGQSIRKASEWSFTISAGVACFSRDASDGDSLLKMARAAVQAAKARGGDTVLLPR